MIYRILKFFNGVTISTAVFFCLVLIHVIKLVCGGYGLFDDVMIGWVVALILVLLLAIGDRQFLKMHIHLWEVTRPTTKQEGKEIQSYDDD